MQTEATQKGLKCLTIPPSSPSAPRSASLSGHVGLGRGRRNIHSDLAKWRDRSIRRETPYISRLHYRGSVDNIEYQPCKSTWNRHRPDPPAMERTDSSGIVTVKAKGPGSTAPVDGLQGPRLSRRNAWTLSFDNLLSDQWSRPRTAHKLEGVT